MQYVTDPRSGNQLSALGFGCMRFPRDKALTEELIVSAVKAGVNYFDTAYLYSNSEATLGAILAKNDLRKGIHLATKLPHQRCKTHEDFDKLFNEQLDRLKTDYIDYYLIHNISDPTAWDRLCDLGIREWIATKKATGEIRQLGFSFHGAQHRFFELLEAYDWDFCQIQYNYMNENYQAGREGLQKAHQKGMPVIIMEPLLGGKLATGLPTKALRLFKQADAQRSAAAWALLWLWHQPEVSVVLSGMNSMAQLEDNLKTASNAGAGVLSPQEQAVFPPVVASISEAYKVPCTGCNYCMPCPQGVNIPGCFAAYNTSYALGFIPGITQYLTGTGANHPEKQSGPKKCVKCRVCEAKCPQSIAIADELTTVLKRMEPFWFSFVLWVVNKIM